MPKSSYLHKKSAGISHILLPAVLVIAVVAVFGVARFSKSQNSPNNERLSLYEEIMGVTGEVAGLQAPLPTGQIVSIPKAECDIFVSTTGNGNGSSENSPMRSIAEAISSARPGQAVCLKGGEYRQVVHVSDVKGTANAVIKIGGYSGGGLPIISGGVTPGDQYMLPDPNCRNPDGPPSVYGRDCIYVPLVNIVNSDYLQVIGLDVRGSSGRGFQLLDSNNILVKGVRSYHNEGPGFQVTARSTNSGRNKDIVMDTVAAFDNIRKMAENSAVGGGALHIHKVDGFLIKNSLVFRNFGEGLDVGKGAKNAVVSGNMFWENAHTALYANATENVTFDRNFLFCTREKFAWLKAAPDAAYGKEDNVGAAITVRNEKGVTSKFGEGFGTIVTNNIVVGCTGTIRVQAQPETALENVLVANNTMVSPRTPTSSNANGLSFAGKLSNIRIVNNIVAGGAIPDYTGVTFQNNIASAGSAHAGVIIADPKVSRLIALTEKLDPATISPDEFVITAGSPAINAGQTVDARGFLAKDFFGNTRGTGSIDLGAYKFGGSKTFPDLYTIVLSGAGTIPDDDDDTPSEDVDTDGDGVPDALDQCDTVSAGNTPDPARPGCPLLDDDNDNDPVETDTDGDGLPDEDDECVDVPMGDNADPERPGCPLEDDDDDPADGVDTDGDGFPDVLDQCDTDSSGDTPDPARPGCPLQEDGGDDETSANLVSNGDFAKGPSNTQEFALGWKFVNSTLADIKVSLTKPANGRYTKGKVARVQIKRNPIISTPAIMQDSVGLKPGTQYRISFVARSSKPGKINATLKQGTLLQQSLATATFDVGNTWKIYSSIVSIGEFDSTNLVRFALNLQMPSESSVSIDNVSITKVE